MLTGDSTAVVAYPNGSSSFLARIDIPTDSTYARTMHDLSLESSKHPTPPYNNMAEWWNDYPRQRIREARKAIGLPASDEVGALSDLINRLRSAAEENLGEKITEAVASTPNLVALYDEDVRDAFEHSDLKFPPLTRFDYKPVSTIAAYLGYGMGICQNYTDRYKCWYEQHYMPFHTVMAVTFTRHVLHVTLTPVQSILYIWEPQYRTHWEWGLGLETLDYAQTPVDEASYWAKVVNGLRYVMDDRPYYPRPDKIILLGESAGDPRFRKALEEAVLSEMDEMPPVYDHDAKFVAARGAAEFAKRSPYDWHNDPNAEPPKVPDDDPDAPEPPHAAVVETVGELR